jgi:hypothetical protein
MIVSTFFEPSFLSRTLSLYFELPCPPNRGSLTPLKKHFAGQRPAPESILRHAMRKIGSKRGWNCAMAIILWAGGLQLGLYAQQVAKLSPKVMALVNAPPVEIKDDDAPLLRLKKERFNAALNEAKARFDLYNRGLTRIPELIAVGERLFGAEVDLYDKPEEKAPSSAATIGRL